MDEDGKAQSSAFRSGAKLKQKRNCSVGNKKAWLSSSLESMSLSERKKRCYFQGTDVGCCWQFQNLESSHCLSDLKQNGESVVCLGSSAWGSGHKLSWH